MTTSGVAVNLIGVHLKSKAPHGANSSDDIKRIAITNRRKQLAQAIWLRARIDQVLTEERPLIVMGDLNEDLFGRSSVEIVLGREGSLPLFDPHAERALSQRLGPVPTTSRFWIRSEKCYLQALLDYIMVSPDLRTKNPVWRIWHPLDDPQTPRNAAECWADPVLREALVAASDHFPVSVDLSI